MQVITQSHPQPTKHLKLIKDPDNELTYNYYGPKTMQH